MILFTASLKVIGKLAGVALGTLGVLLLLGIVTSPGIAIAAGIGALLLVGAIVKAVRDR